MATFIERIEQSVVTRALLRPGQRVLVAVSGGVDSMVLLEVLHRLAVTHRWRLIVAHFNHRLRGRSSDADERLVLRTARRLQLPCAVGNADVRAHARKHKLSIEMAGRALRHAFLARAARQRGLHTVALAHQADDQVELFLLRLLRGAGVEGLAGMKWSNPSPSDARVSLVRPLLEVPKAAVREFAKHAKVPFREDASNVSPDILRNRIRNELLPLLTRRYQPALPEILRRQMALLEAEAECVEQVTQDWLKAGQGTAFARAPVAVQRRVLLRQLLALGVPPEFELIEALRRAEGRPVPIDALRLLVRDGCGRVEARPARAPGFSGGEEELRLVEPSGAISFHGVGLRWKIQRAPQTRPAMRAGGEWFDADLVGPQVVVRHWRPGDRFQPSGLGASAKLQDLLTNAKIPRDRRRRLIIATTSAGEIWWVEGLRIAERFKLTVDTRRRLRWQWTRDGYGETGPSMVPSSH